MRTFWGEGIILCSAFYYCLYSINLQVDQGGSYKGVCLGKIY